MGDLLITDAHTHVVADTQDTLCCSRDPEEQAHYDLEGICASVLSEEHNAHNHNTSLFYKPRSECWVTTGKAPNEFGPCLLACSSLLLLLLGTVA